MCNKLIIAHKAYDVERIDAKSIKGISLELRTSFVFFKMEIVGQSIILLKPKYTLERYTPRACAKMSEMVLKSNGSPCAFWFDALDFNQRTRLMEKNVYFVVSDKYAFLPGLVMDNRNERKAATELNAPAQYVCRYHVPVNAVRHVFKQLYGQLGTLAEACQHKGASFIVVRPIVVKGSSDIACGNLLACVHGLLLGVTFHGHLPVIRGKVVELVPTKPAVHSAELIEHGLPVRLAVDGGIMFLQTLPGGLVKHLRGTNVKEIRRASAVDVIPVLRRCIIRRFGDVFLLVSTARRNQKNYCNWQV